MARKKVVKEVVNMDNNFSKDELEIVLKALNILKTHKTNDRLSLGGIRENIKELFIEKTMEEL